MLDQSTIEKALEDLKLSEKMHRDADKLYYRAKKRLESICSPAVPAQVDRVATQVLQKRYKSAFKKRA